MPINSPSESRVDKLNLAFEVFLVFFKLGLTSFGGPIAHLGYFYQEFVVRRKWIDEPSYNDLVALCQFLPGAASSQVGIALGFLRCGLIGSISAWLGFTLPSAFSLVLFGLGVFRFENCLGANWLHGLKVVAVPIVAQALWSMAKNLSPNKVSASIIVAATTIVLSVPSALSQIGVILLGGVLGIFFLKSNGSLPHNFLRINTNSTTSIASLLIYLILLLILPILAVQTNNYSLHLIDSFYRAGSLVFGGGHVVLPLLQVETVSNGWVSKDAFLAGYGAAQAVPGPLFTFAAYLGSISTQAPSGGLGAVIALVAIFLPSYLIVIGVLPFWERLRRYESMKRAMLGINASVVGLLLAAFYSPVWASSILSVGDFCLAITAFLLLVFWKWPPWLIVIITAISGSFVGSS